MKTLHRKVVVCQVCFVGIARIVGYLHSKTTRDPHMSGLTT